MNTKRIELLLVVLIVYPIAGCSHPAFVVSRDVPVSPTFVVVPATDYLDDINNAGEYESYLLAVGIRVVQLPGERTTVSVQDDAVAHREPQDATGSRKITAEIYRRVGDLEADYIVVTDVEFHRVKIVRRSDGEILTSYVAFGGQTDDTRSAFNEALTALGIPIRKVGQ